MGRPWWSVVKDLPVNEGGRSLVWGDPTRCGAYKAPATTTGQHSKAREPQH